MKSRRNQMVLLLVLAGVLAYVLYRNFAPPVPVATAAAAANDSFAPLNVDNPALRTDLLDHVKKEEYQGSGRNIFNASAPPPPAPPAPKPAAQVAQIPAAPPPALTVPATFFGYVTDARTGARRAFFAEGDDVYVVGVGDVLLGRFRLLQIGNTTAELEETSSGRRTTLTLMEEPGAS